MPHPVVVLRKLLAVVLLLPLLLFAAACGSGATAGASRSSASAQPTLSDEDWDEDEPADTGESDVKKWEKENGIRSSDWYRYVTGREIKLGSLWIYTKLSTTGEAKKVAARMCGSYAQYVLEDEDVTVTFIRAKDGQRLAKCGPDA